MTRRKITQLGNELVDQTEDVLKSIKRFVQNINKVFEYVKIDGFVFDEADYLVVSEKEVKEVIEIFKTFNIDIKGNKE